MFDLEKFLDLRSIEFGLKVGDWQGRFLGSRALC